MTLTPVGEDADAAAGNTDCAVTFRCDTRTRPDGVEGEKFGIDAREDAHPFYVQPRMRN
jgi:hypothetical protein